MWVMVAQQCEHTQYHWVTNLKMVKMKNIIYLFIYFCLSRVAPVAHGCSQARDLIRAAAAATGLHHSHSNAESLTHWARPGIGPKTSWFLVKFVNHWAAMGTPYNTLLSTLVTTLYWSSLELIHLITESSYPSTNNLLCHKGTPLLTFWGVCGVKESCPSRTCAPPPSVALPPSRQCPAFPGLWNSGPEWASLPGLPTCRRNLGVQAGLFLASVWWC